MKKIILFVFAFCFTATASASLIDFRTSAYTTTFGANQTTETVNGVNFTITATAKGANGFRQGSSGLNFGVPGNGMLSLSIVSDTDIEYTSLVGQGHTFTTFAGQLPFDLSVNGNEQIDDLMFTPSTFNSANLASIAVNAGDVFLIAVDFAALTGSNIYASAILQTLSFNTVSTPAAVPLPATLLLFITGLGILRSATIHNRKKSA